MVWGGCCCCEEKPGIRFDVLTRLSFLGWPALRASCHEADEKAAVRVAGENLDAVALFDSTPRHSDDIGVRRVALLWICNALARQAVRGEAGMNIFRSRRIARPRAVLSRSSFAMLKIHTAGAGRCCG